jgi:hypothetical protein
MALREIRECTHSTQYAAWDSRLGFVCSEEFASDEVLSGFPRKSLN